MARPKIGEYKQKPRPWKPIDWKVVDELLQSHCAGHEVAARLGVSYDTLAERCVVEKGSGFSEYKAKLQADGKALLRHAQMRQALKGNTRMLTHLGEHLLGQTSKSQVEHAGSININRVDYTTAQLADNNAADANAKALSDTSMELPGQGG